MGSSFNCISISHTESVQDVTPSQIKNNPQQCSQHNCENREQNVVMNYIKPILKDDDDQSFFQIMKNYQILEEAQIHTKHNRKYFLEKYTNTTKHYIQKKNQQKNIYQHCSQDKYTKSTQFKTNSTKRRSISEDSHLKSILLEHQQVKRTSFSNFCKSVHFEDEGYYPTSQFQFNQVIFNKNKSDYHLQ